MHFNPAHLLPSYLSSALATSPAHQKRIRNKKNQTKWNKLQKPSWDRSRSVLQCVHSTPRRLHIFTCKCSLQWVTGLWLFLCYRYWILTGTPLWYPVFVLCHGDPAALGLQDRSFHELQQFTDAVDAGLGQLKALGLDPVAVELVIPPALLHPLLGWALQHCPSSSPKAEAGKGQAQLSHSHTPGFPSGPTLLCCPGKV